MMATWLRMWSRLGIALVVFLACSFSGDPALTAPQNASAKIDPKLFHGLRYRNIGRFMLSVLMQVRRRLELDDKLK